MLRAENAIKVLADQYSRHPFGVKSRRPIETIMVAATEKIGITSTSEDIFVSGIHHFALPTLLP
jgi:hypothetical protein